MKRKILTLAIFGATFYAILGSEIFFVNVTASLPVGLYLRTPDRNFQRGDYIIYEPAPPVKNILEENGWETDAKFFMKTVGGIGGDSYSITETGEFFIGNKRIGKTFSKDGRGKKLPQLRGRFEISKGYVLPIGTNEKSFDGRYTGVIAEEDIKCKVIPIWTR